MDRIALYYDEGIAKLVQRLKKDWYDLDFRYLAEHPEFRAFCLYENAVGFENRYMDFFSPDAFENRRQYICAFYRSERGGLYREFTYLTPEQADRFSEQTAEEIYRRLKLENRI